MLAHNTSGTRKLMITMGNLHAMHNTVALTLLGVGSAQQACHIRYYAPATKLEAVHGRP